MTAKDTIARATDTARDTARAAGTAVRNGAETALSAAKETVIDRADDARESLSDVGDRLADTLKSATEGERPDAMTSRVFASVADGLSNAADTLRQRSVAELGDDMRAMARRHPGAFMAAAAVAGFAAARFLRASSARRS